MKHFGFVLLMAFTVALSAGAEEGWVRLNAASLPEEWSGFQEGVASRPWVVADFVEQRFFSFRSRPVELVGTVWYGREEGLTLNYRKPRREVVRVDEKGVRLIRDDGRSRERMIPERGREIPATLLSLFRLDFAELEKSFEISGRLDGEAWALRLMPRDRDQSPVQQIELAGAEQDVTGIVIEQSGGRRIELSLSNLVYPLKLDSEERRRIFP